MNTHRRQRAQHEWQQATALRQRSIALPDSTAVSYCPKCRCPVSHGPYNMLDRMIEHDKRVHQEVGK